MRIIQLFDEVTAYIEWHKRPLYAVSLVGAALVDLVSDDGIDEAGCCQGAVTRRHRAGVGNGPERRRHITNSNGEYHFVHMNNIEFSDKVKI